MDFCAECNNMLYPKEDKERKILLYYCKVCKFSKEATTARVYVHHLKNQPIGKTKATAYTQLASDPTLPRTNEPDLCPKCHHDEAVFFQSPVRRPQDPMLLFFVCTNCRHRWSEENV